MKILTRLAATATTLFCAAGWPALANPYVIQGATLIEAAPDVERTENAYLVIDGARIVARGQGGLPAQYAGLHIVDATGRYIMPGLIDSHVHLTSLPGIPPDDSGKYQKLADGYFRQQPKSYLYYGFTTVIDLNAGTAELADFRKAEIRPNILDCGGAMMLADGYPMLFWPEAVRYKANPNFIFNENQRAGLPTDIDPAAHTPEAVATRLQAGGAVCAKFFYERGFFEGANWPLPDDDLFGRVRTATEAAHLPLLVHANAEYSQKAALDHDADILVHGLWHWEDDAGKRAGSPGKSAYALLDRIAETGTGYMPTVQVLAGEAALLDPDYISRPALAAVVPPELIAWYHTADADWAPKTIFGDLPPKRAAGLYTADMDKLVKTAQLATYLSSKGGKLLFGTDTPSAPTWGNPVGLNGLYEMQDWIAAGLDMGTVIRAATYENARAFGLESDYGSLTPGHVADLVILTQNPLDGPAALESIETVVSRGNLIKRDSLRADHQN